MYPFTIPLQKCLVLGLGIGLIGSSVFIATQTHSQPSQPPSEPNMDNIYHEDENLPDDADVFPRMGHLVGETGERNNCRAVPWGEVLETVPGNSFVEIGDRTVDSQGESWFQVTALNCWIHDSRIDLL